MKRLYNDYLAETSETQNLVEEHRKAVRKVFSEAEKADLDFRDLTTTLIMEITATSSEFVLRRAVKMRKAERQNKNEVSKVC